MNIQVPVDQEMKKWEMVKDGTEKTAILVAVREKVLHELDQIIDDATNDLERQVERYTHIPLPGSFSAQVGSAVKLLEENYIALEERGVNQDHLQRVKKSLSHMKRKLQLLNASRSTHEREGLRQVNVG